MNKENNNISIVRVFWRILVWFCVVNYLLVAWLIDAIRFRSSAKRNAFRLRQVLEKMGPAAIKLGQQISTRADLVPIAYCDELSKLLDDVPPFPTEQVIAIIEKATGAPLDKNFKSLDPVPIGAASIACVYQAELLTGEHVVAKVKRPGIKGQFLSDLKALDFVFTVLEKLNIAREGSVVPFISELTQMLMNELDFEAEAQNTDIFRRSSRKIKFLGVPKVFHGLCYSDLIVSEFIRGRSLYEIIEGVTNNNLDDLADLSAEGYDVKLISHRMSQIFYWQMFENSFFHADPHPANVIVTSDNIPVFIDFGSCGSISSDFRRKLMNLYVTFTEEDMGALLDATIALNEPLPAIDLGLYKSALYKIMAPNYYAMKSKHSTWQEKCFGRAWMESMEINRKFGIPAKPSVVHYFRATFLYDSLIYRLDPRLKGNKEFKRWLRKSGKKKKKKMHNKIHFDNSSAYDNFFQKGLELKDIDQRLLEKATPSFTNIHSTQFMNTSNKLSFTISTLSKSIFRCLLLIAVTAVFRIFYLQFRHQPLISGHGDIMDSIHWALTMPITVALIFILTFIGILKIFRRLDEVDIG